MIPEEALTWIDRPWRHGNGEEQIRERMQAFLARLVRFELEHYFYWPPHCAFSIDVFLDDAAKPSAKDSPRAKHQVTIYVSSRAPIATFRIRGVHEKPWWESDRRCTFDRTTKVLEFARQHSQALCDQFGVQLMEPDPAMDEPLPGRFRKLDPKIPATIFSELFSEM